MGIVEKDMETTNAPRSNRRNPSISKAVSVRCAWARSLRLVPWSCRLAHRSIGAYGRVEDSLPPKKQ